jgi:hypothetical protein
VGFRSRSSKAKITAKIKDNAEEQRRRGLAEKTEKDERLLTEFTEGRAQRSQSRV